MNRIVVILSFALSLLAAQGSARASNEYLGFADTYTVQKGDLNGDGKNDLHLMFKPRSATLAVDDLQVPLAHWDPVGDFVLQQTTNGRFSIVSGLTATQRSTIASWPSADVKFVLSDFNSDGYNDVLLTDVSSFITGADDVFVFAPTSRGAAPATSKSWDDDLDMFLRDVLGYLQNPDHYYDDGLYEGCMPTAAWVPVIHEDNWGNSWIEWELQTINYCGTILDVSNFSLDGVEFLSDLVITLSWGDMPSGFDDVVGIAQKFEDLFGIELMRGKLEGALGNLDNFGLIGDLADILQGCTSESEGVCESFFDRLKLSRFFFNLLRELAFLAFCDPPGTPHLYEVLSRVCDATDGNCNVSDVYFNEMLVHPITGYWDRPHNDPFENGESGYAEMGCTFEIPLACDPLYTLPSIFGGFGMFDAGPIKVYVYPTATPYKWHNNVTKVGHIFHPGEIKRYAEPASSGGVQIRTIGSGTGQCPKLNEIGGTLMVWTLDRFIECHINGHCSL